MAGLVPFEVVGGDGEEGVMFGEVSQERIVDGVGVGIEDLAGGDFVDEPVAAVDFAFELTGPPAGVAGENAILDV